MRLTVPFFYEVVGVRAGCRKQGKAAVMGFETVEVPELASEDAPLVLRIDRQLDWAAQGREKGDLEIRARGGSLLRKASLGIRSHDYPHQEIAYLHAPWEDVTLENAQAVLDTWARRSMGGRKIGGPGGAPPFRFFEETPVQWGPFLDEREARWREQVKSNRAEKAAELRELAAKAAFVDGVLHFHTTGPAWNVYLHCSLEGGGERRKAFVQIASEVSWEWGPNMFPIDDWGRAAAYANRIAAGFEGAEVHLGDKDRVHFFGRRVSETRDARTDHLMGAVRRLIATFEDKLGKLPVPLVRHWADLKEAAEAAPAKLDDAGFERLAAAAEPLDAAFREKARLMGVRNGESPMEAFRRLMDEELGKERVHGAVEIGADDLRALGLMK
jgi:hypothetical protein